MKILVIDDIADNIELLVHILKEYELIKASTGKDGIKLAKEQKPDLILLDVMMPDMDGYELIQELKVDERTKNIPVIFISAHYRDVDKVIKGLELGAFDYLTKPIEDKLLLAKIKKIEQLKKTEDDLINQKLALEETNKNLRKQISRRKKAEKALLKSEDNLRITLRSIGEAVITTDIDGKITRLNPMAEKLTGWKFEECQDRDLAEIFKIINAKTLIVCEDIVKQVLVTKQISNHTNNTILIAKNKKGFKIVYSAAPIKGLDEEITGVVLVFRDMTEEYRMQEEFQKMQRLQSIGNIGGGIAHDFNNLLMGLFGNISILKKYIAKDHPGFEYIEKTEQVMNMAKRLTNQLLSFAKGGEPVKKDILIKDLITDIINFDLSGSNVMPVFDYAKDLWMANVDEEQMQQVFSNLTTNAKQAMPDGGHLYITLENENILKDNKSKNLKQGKYIKIVLKDEGIGINYNDVYKIFDPYYTTKQTGSGLGLATVYSIITKHGGHISVDSQLSLGTTFTFYLPASDSQQISDVNQQSETEIFDTKQNYKILVMDDEKIIRDVMVKMLESVNFSVEAAADGEETIEKYKKSLDDGKPFDVIIMDLTIRGGMGGKETIKHILEIDPDAKAIISSGYADDPVMANYADYGFKDVAVKPYPQGELEKILRKILN